MESWLANNSSKRGVQVGRECEVGAAAGPRVLAQGVKAVAAETGALVAVVLRAMGCLFSWSLVATLTHSACARRTTPPRF